MCTAKTFPNSSKLFDGSHVRASHDPAFRNYNGGAYLELPVHEVKGTERLERERHQSMTDGLLLHHSA
ncbi:unnamed protein product [Caretta caretta]